MIDYALNTNSIMLKETIAVFSCLFKVFLFKNKKKKFQILNLSCFSNGLMKKKIKNLEVPFPKKAYWFFVLNMLECIVGMYKLITCAHLTL